MAYSTKLSDALHLLVFVHEQQGSDLTSDAIATSLAGNASTVRQMMGRLRRAGLLSSVTGHARPELARPAANITMLDVYRAVEGDKPLLHLDTHTNPACGVGVNVQLVIGECFDDIQQAAESTMASITLEDIIVRYRQRIAAQL
ncbi:Rrf2 family transcriptional regulator [Candidatus Collinsella stercoripullorum]|uniref:Rrf2 family transcriptional regulator n=1 Tax=Collinsella ihumii TaxID=1720204 RepID=A0A921IRH0_9ACTN|nr:Rrf2 family transcriptional regulator [Candidatus Collinsella stercoripullorum]HJA01670.1 Rrf2 family transcriptional regulator [Candidatus Collinsella stercoripullorum]HJG31656.1 Rrf2 family transcriptional regulator [Collinsella ihumii]